jgi:UDP-N-acetyl-D-mannosaminuronic acid dehydrogenase
VGGHCIPKDPWLLAYGGQGIDTSLIAAARGVNDRMPEHVAHIAQRALIEHGVPHGQEVVTILGIAYRENSDDLRNSPGMDIAHHLLRIHVHSPRLHDPCLSESGDWRDKVRGADCVIIAAAHDVYLGISLVELAGLMRTPVLIDTRHVFERAESQAAGLTFYAVGVG